MRYYHHYNSPIGNLYLGETNQKLSLLLFKEQDPLLHDYKLSKTDFLSEVVKQLEEYFAGKRQHFELDLDLMGTEFQKKVWQELLKIPYGETSTYKDIAIKVGSPQGSRAVGLANNRNPVSIIVPCHRVIGQKGALTGYGGGLEIKKQLLDLEESNV